MEIDENEIFDEGSAATPSVNDAETAPGEASQVAAAEGTAETESTAADDGGADKVAEGEKVPEGQPAQTDDFEKFEKEVDQSLADEKTPKWFKNAVGMYKSKLSDLSAQPNKFEPLKDYGSVEEIRAKLDSLSGLGAIRVNPETRQPEITTEPFAKNLYEKTPDTAVQLFKDMSYLPSPTKEGQLFIHDVLEGVGITPEVLANLDKVQAFAKSGFKLSQTENETDAPEQWELEEVPGEFHDVYKSLSEKQRSRILAEDDEKERREMLEDHKTVFDAKQVQAKIEAEKAEAEKKAELERQQTFQQELQAENLKVVQESGGRIYNSFTDSLVKQANFSPLDAAMIANTVTLALNSPDTVEGRHSLEALKAESVALDPQLGSLLSEWEEVSSAVAFFGKTNQTKNREEAVRKQTELERIISLKGNNIVAALAEKRAKQTVAKAEKQNDLLTKATTPNGLQTNGTAASIGAGGQKAFKSFADSDYANPFD